MSKRQSQASGTGTSWLSRKSSSLNASSVDPASTASDSLNDWSTIKRSMTMSSKAPEAQVENEASTRSCAKVRHIYSFAKTDMARRKSQEDFEGSGSETIAPKLKPKKSLPGILKAATKSLVAGSHHANFKFAVADMFWNMGKEGHFRKALQNATKEALQTHDWLKFKASCEELTSEMQAIQERKGIKADFTDFLDNLSETLEYLQMQTGANTQCSKLLEELTQLDKSAKGQPEIMWQSLIKTREIADKRNRSAEELRAALEILGSKELSPDEDAPPPEYVARARSLLQALPDETRDRLAFGLTGDVDADEQDQAVADCKSELEYLGASEDDLSDLPVMIEQLRRAAWEDSCKEAVESIIELSEIASLGLTQYAIGVEERLEKDEAALAVRPEDYKSLKTVEMVDMSTERKRSLKQRRKTLHRKASLRSLSSTATGQLERVSHSSNEVQNEKKSSPSKRDATLSPTPGHAKDQDDNSSNQPALKKRVGSTFGNSARFGDQQSHHSQGKNTTSHRKSPVKRNMPSPRPDKAGVPEADEHIVFNDENIGVYSAQQLEDMPLEALRSHAEKILQSCGKELSCTELPADDADLVSWIRARYIELKPTDVRFQDVVVTVYPKATLSKMTRELLLEKVRKLRNTLSIDGPPESCPDEELTEWILATQTQYLNPLLSTDSDDEVHEMSLTTYTLDELRSKSPDSLRTHAEMLLDQVGLEYIGSPVPLDDEDLQDWIFAVQERVARKSLVTLPPDTLLDDAESETDGLGSASLQQNIADNWQDQLCMVTAGGQVLRVPRRANRDLSDSEAGAEQLNAKDPKAIVAMLLSKLDAAMARTTQPQYTSVSFERTFMFDFAHTEELHEWAEGNGRVDRHASTDRSRASAEVQPIYGSSECDQSCSSRYGSSNVQPSFFPSRSSKETMPWDSEASGTSRRKGKTAKTFFDSNASMASMIMRHRPLSTRAKTLLMQTVAHAFSKYGDVAEIFLDEQKSKREGNFSGFLTFVNAPSSVKFLSPEDAASVCETKVTTRRLEQKDVATWREVQSAMDVPSHTPLHRKMKGTVHAALSELRMSVRRHWKTIKNAASALSSCGGDIGGDGRVGILTLHAGLQEDGYPCSCAELCVVIRSLCVPCTEYATISTDDFLRLEKPDKWYSKQSRKDIKRLDLVFSSLQLRRMMMESMAGPEMLLAKLHSALGALGKDDGCPSVLEVTDGFRSALKSSNAADYAKIVMSSCGLNIFVQGIASVIQTNAGLCLELLAIISDALEQHGGKDFAKSRLRATRTKCDRHLASRTNLQNTLVTDSGWRIPQDKTLALFLSKMLWRPLLEIMDSVTERLPHLLDTTVFRNIVLLFRQACVTSVVVGHHADYLAPRVFAALLKMSSAVREMKALVEKTKSPIAKKLVEDVQTGDPSVSVTEVAKSVESNIEVSHQLKAFRLLQNSHEVADADNNGCASEVTNMAVVFGGCHILKTLLHHFASLSIHKSEVQDMAVELLNEWEVARSKLTLRWQLPRPCQAELAKLDALRKAIALANEEGFPTNWPELDLGSDSNDDLASSQADQFSQTNGLATMTRAAARQANASTSRVVDLPFANEQGIEHDIMLRLKRRWEKYPNKLVPLERVPDEYTRTPQSARVHRMTAQRATAGAPMSAREVRIPPWKIQESLPTRWGLFGQRKRDCSEMASEYSSRGVSPPRWDFSPQSSPRGSFKLPALSMMQNVLS